jgi:hypothetical protein
LENAVIGTLIMAKENLQPINWIPPSGISKKVAIACALIVAAAALPFLPYRGEIKTHIIDATEILRRQVNCSALFRLPLGYAAFIAPFISAFGEQAGVNPANYVRSPRRFWQASGGSNGPKPRRG